MVLLLTGARSNDSPHYAKMRNKKKKRQDSCYSNKMDKTEMNLQKSGAERVMVMYLYTTHIPLRFMAVNNSIIGIGRE